MTIAAERFSAYGWSHAAVLLAFAIGAVVLVPLGRHHGHTPTGRRVARVVAAVVLVVQAVVLVHTIVATDTRLAEAMPLHISDLVAVCAAYALWSSRRWAFALTYYWGLALSTQALVSPIYRGPDFPDPEFLVFWGMHHAVVWVAVYLTWGLGLRPGWADYRRTVAISVGWAAVAMAFNALTGTNFGFLNRKPETPSLLDVLGPWPWYLVPEILLVLGAWALMTLPWTSRPARPARPAR
ncbi:conserved hypothetical integral membrane protein TIGR02206 [Amycolatopsis arida]|uniref:Conserved hypothetical integral membrane protein TIGR02206 n=1 Tax=Amycolatopsis arida TaxID=587909 RepID=A0A1I6AL86_9PSEU|nr:TIGR02206 family membrane protein [Amycolatopsis arida]TDX87370.1 putative integral membrane protein (TIGR02206 family) [Amycolatopsis arida]SFQ69461.1 conserved hypothetical integral membrane protein TIGR02206 [Amycolatopsis arida]